MFMKTISLRALFANFIPSVVRVQSRLLAIFALAFSAGCTALPNSAVTPPAPTPTQTVTILLPTPQSQESPTGPVTLRIWVPPQFDPNQTTTAGRILAARLDEFTQRRPGVRLEVRVKALDGPAGLLESLTTTSAAAHQALPDLVALPRPSLEAAALKGLLHPMDGLTLAMDDPDWYEYARQLGRVQNSLFGLPFAGDALVLVYRPVEVVAPPTNISSVITSSISLAFPASDPQALFPLALYLSAGGVILDDQGRPTLEESILRDVLAFFKNAEAHEVSPDWLTQYQSHDEIWQVFLEKRTQMGVVWSSSFLAEILADSSATHIPALGGSPYTLATGWVWASASPNPDKINLSVELAEYLSTPDFLTKWTSAIGQLPVRPSALATWQDTSMKSELDQIALSAHLYPNSDVLATIAPPISLATTQVFKQQSDPAVAASEAVKSLIKP